MERPLLFAATERCLVGGLSLMGEIVSLEAALAVRAELRAGGKTVVFTNGHFDLLHVGHVDYLQRAGQLGDALIVGLNSDAVDYVIIFEETTANNLVEALKPDLYVKGGDWGEDRTPPEAKVVASYGGQVRILPYLPEHSTTRLIEAIVERFG